MPKKDKPRKEKPKGGFARIWYFIWEEDSVLSWVVNFIIAFILIKFVVYPGLGLLLATSHPVVAVVSGSMEHGIRDGMVCGNYPEPSAYKPDFDGWWATCGSFYSQVNITKEEFSKFSFRNGFNTGDIMVLRGVKPADVKVGDIIVFRSTKPDPIIHRVIKINKLNGVLYYTTKGDHNPTIGAIDVNIHQNYVIGRAWFGIPWLGYIKIWFVELLRVFGLGSALGAFNA